MGGDVRPARGSSNSREPSSPRAGSGGLRVLVACEFSGIPGIAAAMAAQWGEPDGGLLW